MSERYHKRRRPSNIDQCSEGELDTHREQKGSSTWTKQGGAESEKLERESEIWEALREEHYEAIEQLPLSIHRQFILLRELDEQFHRHNSDLLPSLREYISLRRSAAFRLILGSSSGGHVYDSDVETNIRSPILSLGTTTTTLLPLVPNGTAHGFPESLFQANVTSSASKGMSEVHPTHVADPRTPASVRSDCHKLSRSRALLSHIAWLSDEILRASEEKVNLAQASCDSVERHIHILDQAILEQETSLALGMRPGTHPVPILLPDLVVPRWARLSRVTLSPMPDLSNETGGDIYKTHDQGVGNSNVSASSIMSPDRPASKLIQRGKAKKGNGKWLKEKPKETVLASAEENPEASRRGVRSLRLKVSSQPLMTVPPPGMIVDPKEPRYCYCNQVSFGEMIACDNKRCKREWFHLGCAGLTEAPKESRKWYCRDCNMIGASNRRR